MVRWRLAGVLVVAALGAGAASADAATPSARQYGNPIASETAPPPAKPVPSRVVRSPVAATTPTVAPQSSSLPFTGFDAVVVFGAGAGLVASGLALRRLGRSRG